MNSKLKWGIRLFSLVTAVGMVVGLTALWLNRPAETTESNQNTIEVRDTVTLSGVSIRYQDVKTAPKIPTVKTKPRPELPKVDSMQELLQLFNQMGVLQKANSATNDGSKRAAGGVAETAMDSAANFGVAPTPAPSEMMAPQAAEEGRDGDYSSTNTQVQGVDEGDIIKTDGKYIYIAQGTQVAIVQVNGADMKQVSTIKLEDTNGGIAEMYIAGDKLVLVSNRYEEQAQPKDAKMRDMIWRPGKQFTCYAVYDIADRAKPARTRLFEVEGNALSTRLVGNNLYFAANKYVYSVVFDDVKEADVLPMFRDTVKAPEAKVIPLESLCYFPGSLEASYLLVGAFDITKNEPCDVQSFLGAGSYFYMNQTSMYLVKPEWKEQNAESALYRFSIDGTAIRYEGEGSVAGQPLNQYSMDEHNGYFRIATTDWGKGNYVSVFDSALKMVGQTPPLAADESIQSVRFMGDSGYVVTFRQTDPLFALDLSDPYNPKVLGELKIPGFSQYLHPVGDGLLVGFGRHTLETFVRNDDGTETPIGTQDAGMKISLFDVSDPTNPKEVDKLLLGNGSYSEATNNPRAMMVDEARKQFGFPVQVYDWDMRGQKESADNWEGGMVIGVENRKLVSRAQLKLSGDSSKMGYQRRLCYIGNTLYMSQQTGVFAYNYTSFAKLGELALATPQVNYATDGAVKSAPSAVLE